MLRAGRSSLGMPRNQNRSGAETQDQGGGDGAAGAGAQFSPDAVPLSRALPWSPSQRAMKQHISKGPSGGTAPPGRS